MNDRPWLLERWNDALWSWAVEREYFRIARVAYLVGKVIDR
jgi:hypothetical protein